MTHALPLPPGRYLEARVEGYLQGKHMKSPQSCPLTINHPPTPRNRKCRHQKGDGEKDANANDKANHSADRDSSNNGDQGTTRTTGTTTMKNGATGTMTGTTEM